MLRSDFFDLRHSEVSEAPPFEALVEKVRSRSVVFFVSDSLPVLPPAASAILRRSHLFGVRITHPYDSMPPRFGIPTVFGRGLFAEWFSAPAELGGSPSEAATRPPIPSVDVPVATDPFPPLNRLLSNPNA